MKFEIEKNALIENLKKTQGIINGQCSSPIFSNILLKITKNVMCIIATNINTTLIQFMPVTSEETGSLAVPGRELLNIIKLLKDKNLTLKIEKTSLTIKTSKTTCKIKGIKEEEFPKIDQKIKTKNKIIFEQSELKRMLGLTDFAMSENDSRYVLNGMLLEVQKDKFCLVATDGRRLTLMKKSLPDYNYKEHTKIIIPTKTIKELRGLLNDKGNVTISYDKKQILFKTTNWTLGSSLIEGEFPDYDSVIPKTSEKTIKLSTEDFLSALERVKVFTNNDSLAVEFNIKNSKLFISKNSIYLGEVNEKLDIEVSGEKDFKVGFNPDYFIDVLKLMSSKDLKVGFSDANRPAVIRIGEEYIYVILPIKLTS